jgi:hypothetical protein
MAASDRGWRPAWAEVLGWSFGRAEAAHRDGLITDETWSAYRVIWFYSAPRFSDLVPELPSVREAWSAILEGVPCEASFPWAGDGCPNEAETFTDDDGGAWVCGECLAVYDECANAGEVNAGGGR